MSEDNGKSFAAVDLGSNSFHLIVARAVDSEAHVVDRIREMVRLAAGLDERGHLDVNARTRALACLARFGQRLRGIPALQVRVVGTNTLRRVRDARRFVTEAEVALGHAIEIVSGHEEARLIFAGVSRGLVHSDRRLVIDIGGGSTELIVGDEDPKKLTSLPFGCVGLSQQFFRDGKIDRKAFRDAETEVALELRRYRNSFDSSNHDEAVGSSGTVRAVHTVLQNLEWAGDTIPLEAVKRLKRRMREAKHIDRVDLPGLSDERRPVFAGGLAALTACLRNLKVQELKVSPYALREGVLLELMGRDIERDPRERGIHALADRYTVDIDQASRVQETALDAFDQVREGWSLTDGDRQRLRWACILHEIGLAIAHDGYHRHGAYLIEHSTLNGFSQEEQQTLATMIVGQRRSLRTEIFDGLPEWRVASALHTCALLRLSILLRRSRRPDPLPPINWKANAERLTLRFPHGWLHEHPLTRDDLRVEEKLLRRVGIRLKYS